MSEPRSHPEQIGSFRILRVLGEGGMGVVYEAEQDHPRRTVALKVVKAGLAMDSHFRRFDQETQVLARLHHPGIAQIYEAGTADYGQGPQPYFAMEYVAGSPLLEHARANDLGIPQRLDLMARICDAVQHAHQKGVIHRDLKPGNILVDETGQPKILDFGVARCIDSDIQATRQTDIGQLVGTIPYMSPEQVAADPEDLDVRSDVYALGVVLYELLAGRLPYKLSKKFIAEAVRVIRDEDPQPLSSVDRHLRGDVETIVGKALEKDRARRYQSAADLGSDIRRFLHDEPIVARPPSAIYQLRKFAKRNRALVGGVIAVFLALTAGIIVSTYQAVRARTAEKSASDSAAEAKRNEEEARSQARKSETVRQFLQNMLSSVDPNAARRPDVTVREILDEAAFRVEFGELTEDPEIEAEVRLTLGATYLELGVLDRAENQLERSLEIHRRLRGEDHPDVAEGLRLVSRVRYEKGDYAGSEELIQQALATFRRHFDEKHPKVESCLSTLSSIRHSQSRFEESEALQRQVLAMRRERLGDESIDVADVLINLAFTLSFRDDSVAAEPLCREALEIVEKLRGKDDPQVADCLQQLAWVDSQRGDYESAENSLRRALAIRRKYYAEGHPRIADVLWRLGELLRELQRNEEAESVLREAVQIRRDIHGRHRDTATALATLGSVLERRNDLAGAEAALVEARDIRHELFGEESLPVASSLADLGGLYRVQGRLDESEKALREALAIWDRSPLPDIPQQTNVRFQLAMLLQARRDYEGAEEQFRRNLELQRARQGDEHTRVASAINSLASLLYRKGEKEEAERMFLESLEMRRRLGALDSPGTLDTLGNLAFALEARGAFAEAEPHYREFLAISRRIRSEGYLDVRTALARLAKNLGMQRKWAESEPVLRECLALAEENLPPGDWRIANTRSMLGESLAEQKKFEEAERLLLDAHQRLEENAPPDPKTSSDSRARLVRLYESWGKEERAAEYRKP